MPIHVAAALKQQAASTALTPGDWQNIIWVVTRVMGIVGHPPMVVSVEEEGSPGVLWIDPSDNEVVVVLDYDTQPKGAAKLSMHISENLSEGETLGLVGLCTLRNVQWSIIPAMDQRDDDDGDEDNEEQLECDTKPGS